MTTTDTAAKATEPSRAVLVDRAYDLGITVPKSWNKAKIEKAIADAETAPREPSGFDVVLVNNADGSVEGHLAGCADLKKVGKGKRDHDEATPSVRVQSKHEAWADFNADFIAEGGESNAYAVDWQGCTSVVPSVESAKAPEKPAGAPSTDAKDSKKESSAKDAGKPAAAKPEPEYAIEHLYTDTRAYDVLSRSERMVTVRYRPSTENVTRREEDGSGFPRVYRSTVSDEKAPTYRLRLRKDGTFRMDAWSNPFTFTTKAPESYTDYRV